MNYNDKLHFLITLEYATSSYNHIFGVKLTLTLVAIVQK